MTDATEVKYETRTVKTVRGLEARIRAAQEKQGWEFVSQSTGKARSELTFRRPKPKPPWLVLAGLGGFIVLGFIILGVMNPQDGGEPASDALPRPTATPTPTATVTREPTTTPSPLPQATFAAPPADATPQDITVDALLDKLNSADMGGSRPGDRYHVIGQTFMRDIWMTVATGDYAVPLSAKGGSQDLTIFTDQSTAAAWGDGTLVDLVLEDVVRTVNGETSSGYLSVVSSTVVG